VLARLNTSMTAKCAEPDRAWCDGLFTPARRA
jgi:hypothetical protein